MGPRERECFIEMPSSPRPSLIVSSARRAVSVQGGEGRATAQFCSKDGGKRDRSFFAFLRVFVPYGTRRLLCRLLSSLGRYRGNNGGTIITAAEIRPFLYVRTGMFPRALLTLPFFFSPALPGCH